MPPLPTFLRHTLAATALAAALCGVQAAYAATPLQEAQQLIRQGQYAQALDQVDKHLSDKPKDAQGRFLRGVILTELGKTQDAINVFSKLTEDYPELPEPYNNLAVIYAQQKQYDKAKQALEKAIRTHPAYATAHENLGDIYARMASQAYDKALQIDSSNTAAQTKLAMMRDLISVASKAQAAPNVARPAAPVAAPTLVASAPVAAPVVAPTPAPAVAKPAAPNTVPNVAAKPAEAPKPAAVAAAKPEPKPEVKPAPVAEKPAEKAVAALDAEISKRIESWAADWSKKDVRAYLGHYAKDFRTPGGISRSAWETERQQRIKKPGAIKVSVEQIKISTDGNDQATVRFRQHYDSATLKSSSPKTLVMVKRDGKWLIQQERVGG